MYSVIYRNRLPHVGYFIRALTSGAVCISGCVLWPSLITTFYTYLWCCILHAIHQVLSNTGVMYFQNFISLQVMPDVIVPNSGSSNIPNII